MSTVSIGYRKRGFFAFLTSVFGFFYDLVQTLLPFVPIVFLFYVIDAGVASVEQGSVTPIGNVATTVFGLVSGFISALVAIAGVVYDVIHFW